MSPGKPQSLRALTRGEVRWGVRGNELAPAIAVRAAARLLETPCARSVRRTPLLVSPLEGGRDEIGEEGCTWGVRGNGLALAIAVCAEAVCS